MTVRDVIGGMLGLAVLALLGFVVYKAVANNPVTNQPAGNDSVTNQSAGKNPEANSPAANPPAGKNSLTKEDLKDILKEMVTHRDLDEAAKGWASKTDFDDLRKKVAAVENGPSSSEAQQKTLAEFEKRVKTLEDRTYEQASLTKEVVNWVRDVGNVATLQAYGSKDSDTPASNVQRSGRLKIVNRMNSDQRVVVNGTDLITVLANETRSLPVPVGTVTTQISGEGPISWFIGPQNYTQEIIIAPVGRNPLSTTTTGIWQDPATGILYTVAQ